MKEMKELKDANKNLEERLKGVSIGGPEQAGIINHP